MADGYTRLDGSIVSRVTEDAVLVVYEGEEEWIPRSLIEDGDEVEEDTEDIVVKSFKLDELDWT